jgi:ribosomal protein S6
MNKLNKRKQKLWSDALNEQILCDDLNAIGKLPSDKKNLIKIERGVETYLYSTENENTKQMETPKNHLSITKPLGTHNNKSDSEEPSLAERIGPAVEFDENKSRAHILVTEFDSETAVVKEIVKQLNEIKSDLMRKAKAAILNLKLVFLYLN